MLTRIHAMCLREESSQVSAGCGVGDKSLV